MQNEHNYNYHAHNIQDRTQWTRVNLNSNRTDPYAGLCHVHGGASNDPTLSYAGSV